MAAFIGSESGDILININNFTEILGEDVSIEDREILLDGDTYIKTGTCGDYLCYTLKGE